MAEREKREIRPIRRGKEGKRDLSMFECYHWLPITTCLKPKPTNQPTRLPNLLTIQGSPKFDSNQIYFLLSPHHHPVLQPNRLVPQTNCTIHHLFFLLYIVPSPEMSLSPGPTLPTCTAYAWLSGKPRCSTLRLSTAHTACPTLKSLLFFCP